MKNTTVWTKVLVMTLMSLFSTAILASQTAKTPSIEQEKKEIKRISLGYLVALQQLKPALMAEVMHPQLAKRTSHFSKKAGKDIVRDTTYEQMLKFAKTWNTDGSKFPKNPMNKAYILDFQGTMASVKLESDNWYEYLHLAKIDNQWKIINLYWQYHPEKIKKMRKKSKQ